jgi:hypothetical protein
MSEPYALVGEVLTTEAPTRAAVVIRDGKIDALLREPRSGDLPGITVNSQACFARVS